MGFRNPWANLGSKPGLGSARGGPLALTEWK